MKKISGYIKDSLITIVGLCLSFGLSLLLQLVFGITEYVTSVFVIAVILVSLLTSGYVYGIVAAVISTLAVNFALTFPHFTMSFSAAVNAVSCVVMIITSVVASMLTSKLMHNKATKAESEKERMRANLLRAVSHDLRTPLTTIYASSTTLIENKATMTDEQRDKIVVGIKEEAEWLVRMVENLLSVTRIDSGQVKIFKTPTVLEELIDSVVLKFKKRYPDQKVEIEIPEDMVMIPMDAILIEQVIVNILENAVQHAEGMTRLALSVFILDNRAIFEIRDNGCGIAPDRLDTIFTGYYSSNNDLDDSQRKNAGIGLSVCATIINAHGGDIKAENVKTGGAVFRFTLDAEDEECDSE